MLAKLISFNYMILASAFEFLYPLSATRRDPLASPTPTPYARFKVPFVRSPIGTYLYASFKTWIFKVVHVT